MKKFLSTAMILAVLAATVTGCSNNNNDSSSSSDNSSSVSDSNTSADNSSSESDTSSEDSSAAEDESKPEGSSLTAKDMAANIYAATEWPTLMEVTDAESASFMGIDLSMIEDYYIAMPMMSAHVTEIIVAKPTAGNEAAVQEQIDARFAYVQENGTFYPANEEVVAGAVKGKTDNGYLYMIVHTNGAACAENMMNNPPAEMPGAGAGEDAGTGEEPAAFLTANDMAANIYAATEWPSLMPVTDAESASFMGLDLSLVDDYYIAMPMMSAHVTEIIILLPLEGNEAAVQEQVDARFAYVQENGAFYPSNEEVVAGAVKGVTEDGYIYMIVHKDGALCEENMQNNPPAEMPAM
ncbi:MAG: DUF4358 domain-containing protein [Oscillospiraceae bacterium]|nr:DUF4358 domain-containing protein [Oscillospiraceae bacterium]